jgi:hypothetical protein
MSKVQTGESLSPRRLENRTEERVLRKSSKGSSSKNIHFTAAQGILDLEE